jgi:ribosomal protein S27E
MTRMRQMNRDFVTLAGVPIKDKRRGPSAGRRGPAMSKNDHWIDARFGGKCGECFESLSQGERVCYIPSEQVTVCKSCGEALVGPDPKDDDIDGFDDC